MSLDTIWRPPVFDAQLLTRLTAASPDWLASARSEAFEIFAGSAMPTQKDESWRYIDLDFDLAALRSADESGPDLFAGASGNGYAARAVLSDGNVIHLDGGGPLSRLTERTEPWTNPVPPDLDIFAAAHTAFLADGVSVTVPRGAVIEQPVFVGVGSSAAGTASFPHVDIELGENAEATIIIEHRSEGEHVSVPHITTAVGQGARLKVLSLQRGGRGLRSVTQFRSSIERDGSLHLAEAGLGADLARLHLTIDLNGAGASANVDSVYYGEHDQTLDYRAFVHHRGPNTSSEMFLKGAVQDHASSVFTGLIKIHPDAAGTSAFQTNRNLVLSEGAVAQSVPNLEILCDDVICGHGSTSGPLEEDHLYYLMSRGIERSRAETLLVKGFFDEVLERFPSGAPVEDLRADIQAKFSRRKP